MKLFFERRCYLGSGIIKIAYLGDSGIDSDICISVNSDLDS